MPIYKYSVGARLSDDNRAFKTFKATNPAKAIQLMMEHIRREHGRGDVTSAFIDGDPMPVKEADRKRTIKKRKEKPVVKYDGLTRIS